VLGHTLLSTTGNICAHVLPDQQQEAAGKKAGALWATP
jgi:hypothetical protein